MKQTLTDTGIKALKPRDAACRVADGGGRSGGPRHALSEEEPWRLALAWLATRR